jgi:hypothetical protein
MTTTQGREAATMAQGREAAAAAWSSGAAQCWSPLLIATKTICNQATKFSRLIANNSSIKVWHGYLLQVIGLYSWFQVILQWAGPGYWLHGSTCAGPLVHHPLCERVGQDRQHTHWTHLCVLLSVGVVASVATVWAKLMCVACAFWWWDTSYIRRL